MSAFKAQAMSRDLRQRLEAQLAGLVVAASTDADFMPILKLTLGGESMYAKIETQPDTSGAVDGLGLAQRVYSPHQITLLQQTSVTSVDLRQHLYAEAARTGTKVRIYQCADVDFPASYDLTNATEISEIPSNSWHPLTLSE